MKPLKIWKDRWKFWWFCERPFLRKPPPLVVFWHCYHWHQWFLGPFGAIGVTMELFQWIVQAYLLIFQWNRVTIMIVKEGVDDNGRGGLWPLQKAFHPWLPWWSDNMMKMKQWLCIIKAGALLLVDVEDNECPQQIWTKPEICENKIRQCGW